MIDTYIDAFSDVLNTLCHLRFYDIDRTRGDNVVLGGSMILVLHGINIGRECEDLDVVLYQPTPGQLEYIVQLQAVEETSGEHSPISKDGKEIERHSLVSIVRESLKMNILSNSGDMNTRYLRYRGYQTQSIDKIVEAKASYTYESQTKGKYIRAKDALDLQYIKNNNFNI